MTLKKVLEKKDTYVFIEEKANNVTDEQLWLARFRKAKEHIAKRWKSIDRQMQVHAGRCP